MLNIKKKVDKSLPCVIEKLGYFFNPLILNFTNENNRLLIYYFHGLYKSTAQKELNHIDPQNNITVSQFKEFIDYFLHYNYHFIKPKDLLGYLPADKPYVMITFDDGYFNNTLAIEVLSMYNIPATFFITTKNVTENRSFWWDLIYKHRVKEGISLEKIREEQIYLKNFKYSYINEYINKYFGSKSTDPWSDIDRPFTEAELKEFSRNPFVFIGNHTHNHAILTNYDKAEIKEEFTLSNKILFNITGTVPINLAFPNGNFNSLVLEVAEEIGFRFAFTTKSNINILPLENSKMNRLDRFMNKPLTTSRYINFDRLNYNSKSLYVNLKKQVMFFKKLNLQ